MNETTPCLTELKIRNCLPRLSLMLLKANIEGLIANIRNRGMNVFRWQRYTLG